MSHGLTRLVKENKLQQITENLCNLCKFSANKFQKIYAVLNYKYLISKSDNRANMEFKYLFNLAFLTLIQQSSEMPIIQV